MAFGEKMNPPLLALGGAGVAGFKTRLASHPGLKASQSHSFLAIGWGGHRTSQGSQFKLQPERFASLGLQGFNLGSLFFLKGSTQESGQCLFWGNLQSSLKPANKASAVEASPVSAWA